MLLAQVVRELTTPEPTDAILHHHAEGHPLPSHPVLTEVVELCRAILFPGYFGHSGTSSDTMAYHMGVNVERLHTLLISQVSAGLCFDGRAASASDDSQRIASTFVSVCPACAASSPPMWWPPMRATPPPPAMVRSSPATPPCVPSAATAWLMSSTC